MSARTLRGGGGAGFFEMGRGEVREMTEMVDRSEVDGLASEAVHGILKDGGRNLVENRIRGIFRSNSRSFISLV